jgi:hypothetical protein
MPLRDSAEALDSVWRVGRYTLFSGRVTRRRGRYMLRVSRRPPTVPTVLQHLGSMCRIAGAREGQFILLVNARSLISMIGVTPVPLHSSHFGSIRFSRLRRRSTTRAVFSTGLGKGKQPPAKGRGCPTFQAGQRPESPPGILRRGGWGLPATMKKVAWLGRPQLVKPAAVKLDGAATSRCERGSKQ